MKKTTTILLQVLVSLIPVIYYLAIWNSLPESVPTHYNGDMKPDDFGSRGEMLGIVIFVCVVSIATSLIVINLNKFDPKQRFANSSALVLKISWTVVIFMALIASVMVYETQKYSQNSKSDFSPKYIIAAIALLFVVLGNFMNNIKQNYFVGLRTPWALEDEENWRLTHHLGSKIWFFGGIVMFLLIMLLPQEFAIYVVLCSLVPMVIIPVWYSYRIFKGKRKKV